MAIAASGRRIVLFSIGIVILAAGAGAAVWGLGKQDADRRFWRENAQRITSLKGDAERLAAEGKLDESHATYRQIEQIVAGVRLRDSGAWTFIERCRQDQDRVYNLILSRHEAELLERRAQADRTVAEAAVMARRGGAAANFSARPLVADQQNSEDQVEPPAEVKPLALAAAPVQPVAEPNPEPTPVPRAVATAPSTRPANGAGLPVVPAPQKPDGVSDAQVEASIRKGVDYLLQQFKADEVVVAGEARDETYKEGVNALVVYALLQAGLSVDDERLKIGHPEMKAKVERMKDHLMNVSIANSTSPVTYSRSLRAMALGVYARPEDREALKADAEYLIKNSADGAYTYNDRVSRFDKPNVTPPPEGGVKDARPRPRDGDERPRPRADGSSHRLKDLSALLNDGKALLHNGEPLVPVPPKTLDLRPKNYPPPIRFEEPPGFPWDNSNSFYALLGAWAAYEGGVEISTEHWNKADGHWRRNILQTGEWDYNGQQNRGSHAMNAHGTAALLMTHDQLEAPNLLPQAGREGYSPELTAALAWLEKEDNAVRLEYGPMHYRGYNLYSLARVGEASGFKWFGKHEWYRELAARAVSTQKPDGSWGVTQKPAHTIIDTAYHVLFLSRGRHPVLFNKLRFDGAWNNRTRDAANLTRFATRELERSFNWQVVGVNREFSDWLDSPILLISSHAAPKFTDQEIEKIKQFALAGGIIFTHADGSSARFNEAVTQLARKMFPSQAMADLPQTHPVYNIHYPIKAKIPLRGISNGSRLLWVHSPADITAAWQVRDGTRRHLWEIGVNLFVYAGGKGTYRHRLDSPWIADAPFQPVRTLKVARVTTSGNSDPEPLAWERFARWMKSQTSWQVDVVPTAPAKLDPSVVLAHLTLSGRAAPTAAEMASLRQFVENGGLLVIDEAEGADFPLKQLIGDQPGRFLGEDDVLAKATYAGMEALGPVKLRTFALTTMKPADAIQVAPVGKGVVIHCTGDIASGFLGTNTWGIAGLEPGYARKLMKNLLIWRENQMAAARR